MDTNLMQAYLTQRAAASHAVAGALAPKSAATPAAATGTTSSTAAANASAGITTDDFLTLLVNELKNQDPTQPTDPNEYITQLAQVNSLEQLISINSGITKLDSLVPATSTTTGSGNSGSGGSTSGGVVQAATSPAGSSPALALASTPSAASQIHKPSHAVAAQ